MRVARYARTHVSGLVTLLSESIQLSGEKLFMHASMCESTRDKWFGVSQFAHIHVTFVWFSA